MDKNKDEEDGLKKINRTLMFIIESQFFLFYCSLLVFMPIFLIEKKPSDTEDFSFRNSKGTKIQ